MDGQPDSMVRHAVLWEVISADLFASITGTDHLLAFFGEGFLLLLHFHLVQTRTQHAHAFFAVLDLRFLILTTHHGIGGEVRNAHGRIRRVHRLAAWPRRAERIDAKIFGFDLDVYLFRLGQNRDRHRRRVNAPLLLGCRHSLHAMHATFV